MAVCPEGAIKETGRELGIIQKGFFNGLEFVHGKLRVGEAMSPPLIREVRAFSRDDKITIIDAPPGTSCPVIASMKDADFVLLVTEPTPFGLHDLKLAVGAVKLLGIPCGLVINRSDIGDRKVKALPILMEIPFNRKIAEAYSRGEMIVEIMPEFKEKFVKLYQDVKELVNS
ncbi:MAG: (4Fe-4S)-binding protein, partial [Deltaproteobacteria bacterium]|nr:(4Fe-4S)-binding protein [Deltaproteobacteria bacterium]